MKIKWESKTDNETIVYIEGANSGYPIGSCRRELSKRGYVWSIQPWFVVYDIDKHTAARKFDDDLQGGRTVASLFERTQNISEEREYDRSLDDVHFDDIISFTGSD